MTKTRKTRTTVYLRERTKTKGGTSLFLDFYYRGKHHYEFLGIHTLPGNDSVSKAHNKECHRMANIIRSRKELEITSNLHNIESVFRAEVNFFDFVDKCAQGKGKMNTQQTYFKMVSHFRSFIDSDQMYLSHINDETVRNFREYLLKNLSANSAVLYYTAFKSVILTGIKQGILKNNPCKNVDTIKKTEVVKDYLTPQELELLFRTECNNTEIRRAFLFACSTGLRISDILELQYTNIEKGRLTFRQVKTGGTVYVPLSETALALLDDGHVRNIDGKVFNLPTEQTIWRNLQSWFKQAGITKKLSFHSARHTFAIISLLSGVRIEEVSKLLGHTDLKTTQVYAKIVDELKDKAVAKLPVYKLSN